MERAPQTESLDSRDCWRLLGSTPIGRLAIVMKDGSPGIFPVNFRVHQDGIVFRTAEGSKLAAVDTGALVAFEADSVDVATGEVWSVVARGWAAVLPPHDDLARKASGMLFSWEAGEKDHIVRITPEVITGRRFRLQISNGSDLSLDEALRAGLE
ncbi:pyridoxamine 5'-phosphate oxidase family protein [Microbacterium sp. A93]|uniref:pyridoxamine 5'-phosphate oxidase family protein n=1 Tax=Microbacterium sp. A93 TaxID=3450716 RepID=UPI003F434556